MFLFIIHSFKTTSEVNRTIKKHVEIHKDYKKNIQKQIFKKCNKTNAKLIITKNRERESLDTRILFLKTVNLCSKQRQKWIGLLTKGTWKFTSICNRWYKCKRKTYIKWNIIYMMQIRFNLHILIIIIIIIIIIWVFMCAIHKKVP